MKRHQVTTSSSSANVAILFEGETVYPMSTGFILVPAEGGLSLQVDSDLPESETIVNAFQKLMDASRVYMEQLENDALTESGYNDCCWAGRDARSAVLNIIDKEVAQSGDPATVDKLQTMFDDLNTYVRDYLKMDYEEDQARQAAMATYQDGMGMAMEEAGKLVEVAESAPLNASSRRKHATVVRAKADGTKEYKFPIPDKAHARVALARINQSDLTEGEKARVKKRAYRVLGQSPKKVKESDIDQIEVRPGNSKGDDNFTALGEAEDATIGGSMDDLQLVTIGEATKFDLAKGELEVTFIKPGLNSSGKRFYPKETIAEGVNGGLFNGLKMFVNHASLQELSQRPERSLTEWVSTVKETWTDPATGDGKAKIKVVQTWFKNFLKDLQEAGALPDIGLSIFATGKVKPGNVQGKSTSIVEKFQSAMSIDWVTEPGAGGRVDAIWESHQPMMIKEQELNMLNSMKVDDALKELRESRPDILEAIRGEFAATQQTEAEKLAEAAARKADQDRIAALETKLAESDAKTATEKAARVAAEYKSMVDAALKESKLPDLAKSRIAASLVEPALKEDGEVDETKVKESVATAVKAETDYVDALLKAQGKGNGITGLGESAGGEEQPSGEKKTATELVEADIAKRMGVPLTEATPAATNAQAKADADIAAALATA
jgi:hypothetical protein